MSVSNHFIAVDWDRIGKLPATEDEFWALYTDAMTSGELWIAEVPFGEAGLSFRNFKGLMEFLDWYLEIQELLDEEVEAGFASVFGDLGILYDEDAYAPRPIKKDVKQEWITGAIPPSDISTILERIADMDVGKTEKEFNRATSRVPCDLCPDGQGVIDWIEGVKSGLSWVAAKGWGVLLVVNA